MTLADPAVAITLGIVMFGEEIRGGLWLVPEVVAAEVITWATFALSRSEAVLEKMEKGRRASEGVQKQLEADRDKIQNWENLCREIKEQPADVALAWMLQNPAITAPIIGPRTMDQLNGSLRALEIKLSEETNNRLNEIFPGHKTSPEEYAW